jgi:hypothetical protein
MFAAVYHILYVQDLSASSVLYARLLDRSPIEESPHFVTFQLGEGVMLGLWPRDQVNPPAYTQVGCGGELSLVVADDKAVQDLYARWSDLRVNVLQEPVRLDFGFTFVITDKDGNRMRVLAPAMQN